MEPKIVAVVARGRNGVIGVANGLPWRVSSDLKRYKARTWGKPMIMGRRTFEIDRAAAARARKRRAHP